MKRGFVGLGEIGQEARRPRPAVAVVGRQVSIDQQSLGSRHRDQEAVFDARGQVVLVLDALEALGREALILPLERLEGATQGRGHDAGGKMQRCFLGLNGQGGIAPLSGIGDGSVDLVAFDCLIGGRLDGAEGFKRRRGWFDGRRLG